MRTLPLVHHDPFDRLLVARTICERATIVSADAVFEACGRACGESLDS